MRMGLLSSSLAGSEGVSLVIVKIPTIMASLGHDIIFCAGELDVS